MSVNVITAPESDIVVTWDDLNDDSLTQKLDNANKMADINEKGMRSGIGPVYTPEELRDATGYEGDPEAEGIEVGDDEDVS